MVAMREDLTGWLEAKAIRKNDSTTIAAFIFDWISRYGVPGMVVNDGGAENKKVAAHLMKRYRIYNVRIATYHPQSNGLIERGHQSIVDALAKLGGQWHLLLSFVVWADRITTRRSTGFPPYQLLFGQECVLPVELSAIS